jgi:uncharacterized protein YkwD
VGGLQEICPLRRSIFTKSGFVGLCLFAFVAMNATVAVKAQKPAPATTTVAAVTPATSAAPSAPKPQPAVAAQPRPVAQPQPVAAPAGDPYGFTAWLNATRASYGLPAVGYDPNLSNWAAMNNSHQASRGLGHYVMGPARRQNSAMGNYSVIGAMWLGSPAHRAALLDPSIRYIGIAGLGAYWTFNAN